MSKMIELVLVLCGVFLSLLSPAVSFAKIEGECSHCHTDDNAPKDIPVEELQRMDCISCHAMGTDERIVTLPGGIPVPQVYHYDPVGDLAGGNFLHVAENIGTGLTGSPKGHDVFDLFPAPFTFPPGFIHKDKDYFRRITCAGVNGCHGIRNQMMHGPGGILIPRDGVAALKGAHHGNVDGQLVVADEVGNSYRFLMGLQGLEHSYDPDRWQNVSALIHNEYFGSSYNPDNYKLCSTCHVGSPIANLDSYITTPRNSMSGFCATCHSDFHMQGGTSVFLRHPADFVIPNKGEYARYTSYEISAPVARPTVYPEPSDIVHPGTDMVMCLSCHVAHASKYDGMLRFDYSKMRAGYGGSSARTGCFACHTSKGGP